MALRYRTAGKRVADAAGSIVLLAGLSPVCLATVVAIKLDSRGPAIFKQTRIGYAGRPFEILKFRTMLITEERGGRAPTESVTRVGKVLRRLSIDELPQLINVLRGEMSIIGPRPTLPYQVQRYNERQSRRLEMRPGLTGLAQVSGRNDLTWEEKIEVDLEYVDKVCLPLDLEIAARTLAVIFRAQGTEFSRPDAISEQPPAAVGSQA